MARASTLPRIAILALLVGATPAVLAQVAPEDDPGFLERIIQNALGGEGREVQIRGLQGALSGAPRIAEITVADADGVWLRIADVALDWRRLAIFRRELDVTRLEIGLIDLARAPLPPPEVRPTPETETPDPDPEGGGFALPELPVSVLLESLSIGELSLGAPLVGQAARFGIDGAARLAGGSGDLRLMLERRGGPEGLLDLEAGFANDTKRLTTDLDLREGAGGIVATLAQMPGAPSLALTVSGDGPIADFLATLSLSTDEAERLSGTVRLGETPLEDGATDGAPVRQTLEADLGGDITPLFIPDYRAFFGPDVGLSLRASRVAEQSVSIEALEVSAAALDLAGSLELTPGFSPRVIDLSGTIADPLGLPVVLPLPGPGTLIRNGEIDVTFDAAEGDALNAAVAVSDLQREDGILVDDLALRADGRVSLSDVNGIEAATADIVLDLAGLSVADPRLNEAAGDAAQLSARADWSSEGRLVLSEVDLQSGDVELSGDATVAGLAVDAEPVITLDAALRSGPLARFATLAGTALTGSIATQVSGMVTPGTGVFDLALDGSGQELGIGQPAADALLAGGPLVLELAAARGADGLSVDRLMLQNDALQLEGDGRLASTGGAVRLDGRIADLAILGEPGLAGPLTLDADLDGTDDVWDARIALAADDARLNGSGKVENLFSGQIALEGDADIATGDLARFARLAGLPLEGEIMLDATGRFDSVTGNGAVDADGRVEDLAIGQPQADALLAGLITLDIAAARTDGTIAVDSLSVDGDALSLQGGGQIEGDGGDLRIEAAVPELGSLGLPGATGPLTLTGALAGADDLWDARLDMSSNEASVAATAALDGLIAGTPDITGAARIETGTLARFAPLLGMPLTGRVSLDAQGRFDTASGDGALTAEGSGTGLSIGQEQADALLAGRLSLAIDAARTAGDITIDTAQLQTDQVRVTAEGTMQGGAGRFDLTAGLANLASVVDGLQGPVDLRGAIEGEAQSWDVAGNLTGPNGITAVVSGGAVRPDGSVDLALEGSLPLLLAESFIQPRTLVGEARLDFGMRGQPGLNALSGTLSIDDARFADPTARQAVEDIDLTVTLADARATVALTGRPTAGGLISVSGPVGLTAPFDAAIAASLEEVRLVDPTLYELDLVGNANLQGPLAGGAAITAGIVIDRAEISIPSGLGGAGAIPEVSHIAEPDPSRETRRRAGLPVDPEETEAGAGGGGPVYDLDLTIAAPRRVFIRGRGLDVELGGGITVGGTTANPIPGGGMILRRGQMNLLGQRLEFDKAEINLQGNLVPDLDMVATSSTSSVRASIEIMGPVTAPEIAFTSQPELPEDEVLAQLFFGKPISELTPLELGQLLTSVNQLSGGGFDPLSRLRSGLGVDTLGVSTDDEGEAALTAGRYITERLHSDVTVGADGTSEVELNYDFNSTLRGRAAVDSVGDSSIGFAFERDF